MTAIAIHVPDCSKDLCLPRPELPGVDIALFPIGIMTVFRMISIYPKEYARLNDLPDWQAVH